MRWAFLLFFAGLAMIPLGEWGFYIGFAGVTLTAIHGIVRSLPSPKVRKMVVIIGLVVSGFAFLGFGALALKPTWFGLSAREINKRPLAGLTNAQLREKTIIIASGLRKLEQDNSAKQIILLSDQSREMREAKTDDEKKNIWRKYNDLLFSLSDQKLNIYRSDYKADVLIVKDELEERLGSLPMPKSKTPFEKALYVNYQDTFQGTVLAGAAPLEQAANLLIYWAKQLP